MSRPTFALATSLVVLAIAAPVRADDLAEHQAFLASPESVHDELILAAAVAWELDPWVFRTLLRAESRLDPLARHPKTGAIGIAQLSRGGRRAVANLRRARGVPATLVDARKAFDPEEAIPAAAELLRHLVDRCRTVGRALRAYHTRGCGPPDAWARMILRRAARARRRAGLDRPPNT
jgi:soluble lytic murein transglycosylase-like protein